MRVDDQLVRFQPVRFQVPIRPFPDSRSKNLATSSFKRPHCI